MKNNTLNINTNLTLNLVTVLCNVRQKEGCAIFKDFIL